MVIGRYGRRLQYLGGIAIASALLAAAGPGASSAAAQQAAPRVDVSGKVTTGASPAWLDWVPLAGLIAAVATAWFIYGQLRSADRASRQSRAAAVGGRWNDRAFRTTTS